MAWFDFAKRRTSAAAPDPVALGSVEAERPGVQFVAGAIGGSGLRQYGGYIQEEFLKELAGPKAALIYREMSDNDPIIGAVIFAISMLIRQVKWSCKASDESPEGEIGKEFLESALDDMTTPLPDVIDEITSMFAYGFAPLEIVWKRRDGSDALGRAPADDGRIGVRAISLRAQPTVIRWQIDPADDSIDGLWQQPFVGPQVFIPIEKMLLFRTTTTRSNPEGRSILRNAYKPWYFKKKIEEIEAIGVERDLAGLPVATIPGKYFSANANNDDRAVLEQWKQLVQNVRRDQSEGLLLPSDRDDKGNLIYEFKLLNSGGTRALDTTKIVDRYNRAIATSVLADFIFLGQSAVGSFALSSDKTALFNTAISGFVHSIAEVFNRHFIPRLWELNNFDPAMMPTMEPGDIEKANLAELSAFLTSLAGAGMPLFPDREMENFLREVAGLPQLADDGEGFDAGGPGYDPADPQAQQQGDPTQQGDAGGDQSAPGAPARPPKPR